MEDCEKLAACAFMKAYESDENTKFALRGFVRMYCKGERKDICIRKKVSKTLGGPEHVPLNMMPDGLPILGTSNHDWPEEVRTLVSV
jgi:hypothetical protein